MVKPGTFKLTMDTKEAYIAQARSRINEIIEGEARVEKQKQEAPELIQEDMDACAINISGYIKTAEDRLADLQRAGVNEWAEMREPVDSAIGCAQAELERAHELLSNPYARVRKPGLFPREHEKGD